MISKGLSDDEKSYYRNLLFDNSEVFNPTDGSREEYQRYLGGLISTPLGAVRMGANQYAKFLEKKRGDLFVAARMTLEKPVFVFTAENGAVVYVKSFVKDSGKNINIVSAVIERNETGVVITTHEERLNQILSKIKKTGILYEKAPGL